MLEHYVLGLILTNQNTTFAQMDDSNEPGLAASPRHNETP